jgi:hypothetical protein
MAGAGQPLGRAHLAPFAGKLCLPVASPSGLDKDYMIWSECLRQPFCAIFLSKYTWEGFTYNENQDGGEAIKWRRVHIWEKCKNKGFWLSPLAALNRHSALYIPPLVQPCGRCQGLTCKVHSGKGLPGRQGGVVGRLFRHQGPFSSTEGSRSVLNALFSNRNCGGLERWLKL